MTEGIFDIGTGRQHMQQVSEAELLSLIESTVTLED